MPFDTATDTTELRTLADLRRWVQTHGSLLRRCEVRTRKEKVAAPSVAHRRDTRTRDTVSAISRIARWVGQPLEAIAADWDYLAGRLATVHGALQGLNEKTIKNALAALRGALAAAHADVPLRQRGLDPAWLALMDLLPSDSWLCRRLLRFARYCSQHGISPVAVLSATFVTFLDWLKASLAKNPQEITRNAAKAWNKAAATIPGWPQQAIEVPSFRAPPTSIDLALFPTSFQDDYRRCAEHLRSRAPFVGDPNLTPLAASTAEVTMRHLKYAGSVLVRNGRDIETIRSVAEVVDPQAVREVLTHYFRKAGNKQTLFIATLARSFKSIARRYVGADEPTLALLAEYEKKMTPAERGLTPKNMERLRQFTDERHKLLLLEAPEKLIERVFRGGRTERGRALDLMVAAAVAILLFAPVRLANLAAIELGRHLRLPVKKNEPAYLHFDKNEVKNDVELDFEIPPEAVQAIATYLEHGRPHLMDAATSYLFYGDNPELRVKYLARWIPYRLHDVTGLQINVHLFRHIAAKFFLDENPGCYETVRILLGHKDINTTIRFYCGLERAAAIRYYDQEVLKLTSRLQGEAKKAPRRKPKRDGKRPPANDARPEI